MGLPSFRRHILQDAEIVPNTCCKRRGHGREQILEEFSGKEVIVCGDGQCDSPRHTAKNLCSFLMELIRVTSWKLKWMTNAMSILYQ